MSACAIGRYNICRKLGFVGLDGRQGGFAEKCVVGARWVHPLGDIPTDLGALVEPLAVAYHAVRLSGLKPGDTAAVFGVRPDRAGHDGRAQGRGRVEGVRGRAGRRPQGEGTGRGRGRGARPDRGRRPDGRISDLTGGGADVAFECAGMDAVLGAAIGSVRPGGTVVNVAIWGHEARVAVNELVFSEINLIGTLAYCEDHPSTSACCATGRSPPASSSPAGSGSTTWCRRASAS